MKKSIITSGPGLEYFETQVMHKTMKIVYGRVICTSHIRAPPMILQMTFNRMSV